MLSALCQVQCMRYSDNRILMRDLKAYLVDYNRVRSSHPPIQLSLAKILLGWDALQVLSFLCLKLTSHGDLIVKSVQSVISLFNLPYFCKTIGLSLLLPLAILLLLNLGYILMTLLSVFMTSKYKKLQDWSLNALCKLEHYTLKSEAIFLFGLAIGMEAIFQPQNFISRADSMNSQKEKIPMGLGIALVTMSVLQYYWFLYVNISISYDTESITELRSSTSKLLRGALLALISALAYTESSVGVFTCVGVYLLHELALLMGLGSHSNIKLNHFTLRITITHLTLYTMLLPTLWSNPDTLITGLYSQRSLGVLLLAPLVARLILNLEKRRMNYVSYRAIKYLSEDNIQRLSLLEVTQLDFVLRQMLSKFTNLREHGPEIYEIIKTILQSKRIEDSTCLTEVQDNLLRIDQEVDLTDYYIKNSLKSQFFELINSTYSSILSRERKGSGTTTNIGCYFSYITFHKDITGNLGKAFIILSELQKALGSCASSRAAACIELVEQDLQRKISKSGTQKTICAELLFSFLDRSEKIQSSIENYISNAFSFYEMLQQTIVSTKDIKNKGKKLLNDRATIIRELDSLIEINEYHQQTLLLYEFFLSEIIEEKAEGRFFQIKNKIDIFHAAGYYTLYRQQKMNDNATDLEIVGWDMSIEFFANQLDGGSDYSVVVFNLNPEYLGKIMKCSTNLFQLLGAEAQDARQMNISNMEVTLFNPKNLKTLQEKILRGEMDLRSLAGEDRTLYLKHQNGCLIACSFVADVEIFGDYPCITCYLRKKKIHEQDFILFALDTEAKFVGLSKALRDGIKKKSARSGIDSAMKSNFRDTTDDLNIIELVPSLQKILPNIETSPIWSESQVLLTIPSVPQLLSVQGYYIISYIGKAQDISLLKQKLGVIEIQSYFPTSIHKHASQGTTITIASTIKRSSPVKSVRPLYQSLPLKEEKDQNEVREFRNEIDEVETNNPFQSQEIATTNKLPDVINSVHYENILSQPAYYDSNLMVPQDPKDLAQGIKLDIQSDNQKSGIEEGSFLKFSAGLQNYQGITGKNSLSGSTDKEARLEKALQEGKLSDKITDGRASSIGSSIGAHMGYLRTLILENKTPAVLKAVNLFGVIIFVTTVTSILVTYFILSGHYYTFSLFAQSAAFPAFVKTCASSFMIATELTVSAQLFFPLEMQFYWKYFASMYAVAMFPIYLPQSHKFTMNFGLPFLNEDIPSKSIAARFPDFPQLDRNMSFYEVNDVFNAYAYKLTYYNYLLPNMDPTLLDFTRTFMPSFYNMYGEISIENFKKLYSLYDASMITLDVLLAIGLVISFLLMAIFLFVYWRYEKMETFAFTKLCSVTMKELEPNLKKILLAYQHMFGKILPQLKNLQETFYLEKNGKKHKNSLTPLKGAEVKTRRLLTKKAVTEKSSNLLIVLLVLFISLLLSAPYLVINALFKTVNAKALPLIIDLEKACNGYPVHFTMQTIMMRLFNEAYNPQVNEALPKILETYESILNESLSAHKLMNEHILNSLQRMESSDVLSENTKLFVRNMTNSSFCTEFIAWGGDFYNTCRTGLKSTADTGYLATSNHIVTTLNQQIQNFRAEPTFFTIAAFYYSTDSIEFMTMNMLMQMYLTSYLQYVHIDLEHYSQRLLSQAHVMLGVSLSYNIGLLILIWIPTITYLSKRFKLSRSIFLLFPTKVLQHNIGIRNLFKIW